MMYALVIRFPGHISPGGLLITEVTAALELFNWAGWAVQDDHHQQQKKQTHKKPPQLWKCKLIQS